MNIYTDGSCLNNQSLDKEKCFGGWAGIILFNDNQIEISDGKISTTNNEMELTAVVEVLDFIKNDREINIKDDKITSLMINSDSSYVVNAVCKGWLDNWIKKDFILKKGKRPNWKLWKRLNDLRGYFEKQNIEIKLKHVYGHSGNFYNERVDKIARERAMELGR
jgi:ribonuclease HI